jgi:hypothetical protein
VPVEASDIGNFVAFTLKNFSAILFVLAVINPEEPLGGYLVPDTTKRAVRVPRTRRLKTSANPPNLVTQLDADSTFF